MISFIEKLALLRAAMKENSIDACIIPSTDPHLGEYVPDQKDINEWLTENNKTGSKIGLDGRTVLHVMICYS